MTSAPTVSVLMTAYNRERYIGEAIKSVLNSSFTNFELIIVDDGSSDETLTIARDFSATDKRVQVHVNESNLGDYPNRNHAVSLAKGEYIKFVDSDDLIYPHGLEVMLKAMQLFPDAGVGLAHSLPEDRVPYPWKLSPKEAFEKHFLETGCIGCGPTGAIIKRSAFENAGPFRESWGVLADYEMWLRLAGHSPLVLLPPGLVWWRRHENQEYCKSGARSFYLRRGFDLEMEILRNTSLLPQNLSNRLIKTKRKQFARSVLSLAIRQRLPRESWNLFRASNLSIFDLARAVF